jgi:hypothetical protein
MSADEAVLAVVQRYVACAQNMDFVGRKALWDRDEPLPILCPEESEQALIGWEALDAYWSASRQSMASLKAKAVDHAVTLLADDIALVTYRSRWIAEMAGAMPTPAIAADVRMTALLREKPEGWRYFQLVEGPVDMLTMARQAAERSAVELFPAHGVR